MHSIYFLIKKLTDGNHELVAPFNLKNPRNQINSDDAKAYLLKFPEAPVEQLFSNLGYQCNERHLRIDKKYMQGSAAHYTEHYLNSETQQLITVHVYFSEKGTSIQLSDNSIEINEDLHYRIMQNTYSAHQLYLLLKIMNAQELTTKLNEANALENQLTAKSSDLNTKEDYIAYIEMAEKFIELIKQVNLHNDDQKDTRGVLIQKRIDYLNLLLVKQSSIQVNNDTATETVSSVSTAPVSSTDEKRKKSSEKKIDKNETRDQRIEELCKLESEYQLALKNKNFVKAYELNHKIRFDLIEVRFDNRPTRAQKQIIDSIESKIFSLEKPEIFALKLFKKGDVDSFFAVFDLLNSETSIHVISGIMIELLEQKSDEGAIPKAQREICEKLFETSSAYKAIISIQNHMFRQVHHQDYIVSILISLALENKENTFEMLLRHGHNPNGVGAIKGANACTLLKFIACTTTNPFFIKTLLKHGALIDAPQSVYTTEILKQIQKNVKQILKGKESSSKAVDLKFFSESLAKDSDLAAACMNSHIENAEFLLEHSRVEYVAAALAIVTEYNDVFTRYVVYGESGVNILNSVDEANQLCGNLNAESKTLSIMLFPDNHQNNSIPLKFDVIKKVNDVLKRRLLQADNKEIITFLDQYNIQSQPLSYKYSVNACRFIISYIDNITFSWAERFARYCCLYAKNAEKGGYIESAFISYFNALQVCKAFCNGMSSFSVFAQSQINRIRGVNQINYHENNFYSYRIIRAPTSDNAAKSLSDLVTEMKNCSLTNSFK
jgi:hypothetical protein